MLRQGNFRQGSLPYAPEIKVNDAYYTRSGNQITVTVDWTISPYATPTSGKWIYEMRVLKKSDLVGLPGYPSHDTVGYFTSGADLPAAGRRKDVKTFEAATTASELSVLILTYKMPGYNAGPTVSKALRAGTAADGGGTGGGGGDSVTPVTPATSSNWLLPVAVIVLLVLAFSGKK